MGWRSWLFVSALLAVFVLSASSSRKLQDMNTEEIYEIDYRGPQTHSLLPPPCSSQPGPSLPFRVHNADRKGKPCHG